MSPSLVEQGIETPPRAPSPVHRFGTRAVHAGSPVDPVTGAVIEPVRYIPAHIYMCILYIVQDQRADSFNQISLSTTFAQTAVGKPVGAHEYVRSSNPNR